MGKLFATIEADCISDCSSMEAELADLDVLQSRVDQLNAQNDALVREVQRLEVLCDHDAALDVLNRRGLAYALQSEISLVRRYRVVSCFIYFDLDYFKQINDCYGHAQGDHILEKMVDHISSRLRQSDHFARLGGDEFAIILSHTTREQGLRKMARLAKSIARVSKAWGPGAQNLTFSAGVSEITSDLPPEDIIARADELMYLSKKKA